MSSAIKLVVTDVDGTLVVPHSHVVSRANLETIARLERAGIHVALATARPPEYARAVAGNLQFKGLHVVDGGASVYDYDKNAYVWQEWLPMNTIQAVATVLLPYAKNVIDCFPGFKMLPVTEFTIDDITEPAPYVYTQIAPSDWPAAVQALRTIKGIDYSVVTRDTDVWHVQVYSHKGTKQHGVQKLQQLLGVTKAQTLALGDNQNDEPLFAAAGTTVAMGNATDELKNLATYVTQTVQHDGWAAAIDKFIP